MMGIFLHNAKQLHKSQECFVRRQFGSLYLLTTTKCAIWSRKAHFRLLITHIMESKYNKSNYCAKTILIPLR